MTNRHLLCITLLAFAGCKKAPVVTPTPDSGTPGAGACTTAAEAMASCPLQAGVPVQQYICPAGTADWYYVDATQLPPRALMTVTAGYHAPSSPVTLEINVLDANGTTSLGSVSDPGMNGAPSVFTLTLPLTDAGAYYIIAEDDLSDAQNPSGDADCEHEYTLSYTIASDPDTNGHTYETATQVSLSYSGTGDGASATASASGVLSTDGDVDYFSVSVEPPSGFGSTNPVRPILYFSVNAPQFELQNTTTIQYAIYDTADAGATPLATGTTTNPTADQSLATAILVPGAGQYYVTIQGEPSPAPGNSLFAYTLSFQVIPDLDVNEPNDDPGIATPIDFTGDQPPTWGPSGPQGETTIQKIGRIAYVPDPDWYEVKIPASSLNTRLFFNMSFDLTAPNDARYPPMPLSFFHQLQIAQLFPAADVCENECPGDPQTVASYCTAAVAFVDGGALYPCVYSVRYEDPSFSTLGNFEGVVPIAANPSAETDLYLLVQNVDLGSDDQAYYLNVTWEPATVDEQSSYYNSYTDALAVTVPIQSNYSDVPATTFPAGSLSYGHFFPSQQGDQAPNNAAILLEAANDYDALADQHVYEVDVPVEDYPDGGTSLTDGVIDGGFTKEGVFIDGGPNYINLSMSLQWVIPPGGAMPGTIESPQDAGSRPWDMYTTFLFCDPNENSGCNPVAGTWRTYALGFAAGSLASWEGGPPTPVYSQDQGAGSFLALPPECLCLESRFVHGLASTGKFYVQTYGVDRTSYDDSNYQLSVSLGPYPQVYINGDGGSGPCPSVCHFCAQGGGGDCPQVTGLPTNSGSPP